MLNLKPNIMTTESTILRMTGMMKSIFTYGELKMDDSYLKSYKEKLSKDEFEKTFISYTKYLKETYKVEFGTYTDDEGCIYNSLIKK